MINYFFLIYHERLIYLIKGGYVNNIRTGLVGPEISQNTLFLYNWYIHELKGMIYTRSTHSNGKCKTYGGKILIFHVYPEGHEKVTIQNISACLFIIFCLLVSPTDKDQYMGS